MDGQGWEEGCGRDCLSLLARVGGPGLTGRPPAQVEQGLMWGDVGLETTLVGGVLSTGKNRFCFTKIQGRDSYPFGHSWRTGQNPSHHLNGGLWELTGPGREATFTPSVATSLSLSH